MPTWHKTTIIRKEKEMKTIWNFLFHTGGRTVTASTVLLLQRILFGGMLMMHGIQKIANFSDLSFNFPDPLNIGSMLSVSLAIFAEVVCSVFFIFGCLHRLVLLPMIFTMGVAFVLVHNGSVPDGELAFVYLCEFIFLYIAGTGRYSIDEFIGKALHVKGNR